MMKTRFADRMLNIYCNVTIQHALLHVLNNIRVIFYGVLFCDVMCCDVPVQSVCVALLVSVTCYNQCKVEPDFGQRETVVNDRLW